jgi:hypothetical protein
MSAISGLKGESAQQARSLVCNFRISWFEEFVTLYAAKAFSVVAGWCWRRISSERRSQGELY